MRTDATTTFTPEPIDDADLAWLLRALFAEPAPEENASPTCGLDAAFERADRHLAWFDADSRAREVA